MTGPLRSGEFALQTERLGFHRIEFLVRHTRRRRPNDQRQNNDFFHTVFRLCTFACRFVLPGLPLHDRSGTEYPISATKIRNNSLSRNERRNNRVAKDHKTVRCGRGLFSLLPLSIILRDPKMAATQYKYLDRSRLPVRPAQARVPEELPPLLRRTAPFHRLRSWPPIPAIWDRASASWS